jgi:NADH-quinone oxidoreductase subunit G
VLRALAGQLQLPGFDFTDLAGLRALLRPADAACGEGLAPTVVPDQGLERIVGTPIYRADAVTRRAAALNAHPLNHGPRVVLHPEEALARGLGEGAMAVVGDGQGSATLQVATSLQVPRGAAWVEGGHAATAPLSATVGLSIVRAAS